MDVRGSQDTLPDVQKWSGGPPGCPGVVGWPSWMSESGRETLPNVQEWWEVPRCPGKLAVIQECSEGPRMSGSGRENLLDFREALSDV